MKINRMLQAAKWGYVVLSVLICALGICLIALPGLSGPLLCKLGGILLVVFGCIKIVGYLSRDPYCLAFQFDLAFGIMLIALGLILIFCTDTAVTFICILLGVLIFADALLKIQTAIEARNFGIPQWWLILILAIITAVFGLLLLFQPRMGSKLLMIMLGISFLGDGLLNLATVLSAVRISKKQDSI
ncbi:MAG: HdeD family acid-resistance protein [Candidatus Limivicinus sp.]|jgi:uncharacterized membrane protein HdeD (DUF308 family)